MWQPALRDSQEVHMIGGLPRLQGRGSRRSVQRDGRQRDAEPRAHLRLPAGHRRPKKPACADEDPHEPGAPRLPPAGHGGRRRGAAGVLQAGARERRQTSTPASAPGSRASSSSPSFLYRIERDPAGVQAGRRAPGQRRRARVAPVVLPVEQHPGREAAEPGRGRPAPRSPACSPRRCGA